MIYIVTALAIEARPLIKHFGLKKTGYNFFREYASGDILLVISGTGKINSACAVSDILSRHQPGSRDAIINFGICGSVDADCNKGETFFINKVVDNDTQRVYYPDIMIDHGMQEAGLRTYSMPVAFDDCKQSEEFVDMEGSGFFQAASHYLGPHSIYVIKILSDFLNETKLDRDFIRQMIESKLYQIETVLYDIKKMLEISEKQLLNQKEQKLISDIKNNLNLTVSQKHLLDDIASQYKIRTNKSLDFLEEYSCKRVTTKHERNKLFGQIKARLT
ncbi:MAG: hypothetical protein PHP06_06925 [Clostridia bacterium]|nr:hypothetical protein [Clostridia bacterium]